MSAPLVLGVLSIPLMCLFGLGFVTALLAIALGVVRLTRRGSSTEDRRSAMAGIALGILCIAVPLLLSWPAVSRSRMARNEGATITDIRSIITAEVEYAKANGDHYDSLECLAAPAGCIPGYDAAKPGFLDAALASARLKSGYRRTFHAGPAPEGGRTKGASPTSIAMFAYVAVPDSPGSSGRRSFCGDGTGRVCAHHDGSAPAVSAGRCAESCPDLR